MTKEFGVGLRVIVEESGDKQVTKEDVKNILNKALNSESSQYAEIVLSGEIDGVKELVS